jgi:hypothetical protein
MITNSSKDWRQIANVILVVAIVPCVFGDWRQVAIMLSLSVVSWIVGKIFEKRESQNRKENINPTT